MSYTTRIIVASTAGALVLIALFGTLGYFLGITDITPQWMSALTAIGIITVVFFGVWLFALMVNALAAWVERGRP